MDGNLYSSSSDHGRLTWVTNGRFLDGINRRLSEVIPKMAGLRIRMCTYTCAHEAQALHQAISGVTS